MKRSNLSTEKRFREAGISAGMKVLELGCGPGEITEVLCNIVGKTGSVLALDNNEQMLKKAKQNLEQCAYGQNHPQLKFLRAELNQDDVAIDIEPGYFDAIVGRRVLMYLKDPQNVILRLLPCLKARAIAVFEEADATMCPASVQNMPAHKKGVALLNKMLGAEGVDLAMGFHLPDVLNKAGMKVEKIWAEAVIDGQNDQFTLAELLNILDARFEATGIACSEDIAALTKDIISEQSPTSVFISSMRFSVKASKLTD